MVFPELSIYQFTVTVQATEEFSVPEYKGSMIRGAFGKVFRESVCITKKPSCTACPHTASCSYYTIFETSLQTDAIPYLRNIPKTPHPFLLVPPADTRSHYHAGETFKIGLTIFGSAIRFFPVFILILKRMGEAGIGRNRGNYRLKHVHITDSRGLQTSLYDCATDSLHTDPVPITIQDILTNMPAKPRRVQLRFRTPLRLQEQGQAILSSNGITPLRLLIAMERRYHTLAFLFGSGEYQEPDPINTEHITITDSQLRLYDWERYSARQQKLMKFGGLTGHLTLTGGLETVYPLISIGSMLHIGKNTVFGMGAYEVNEKI